MSHSGPRVLGVRLTPGRHAELVERVADHIRSGEGCWHVTTVNPEYVMEARRDPAFAAALDRASLATIDGAGLMLAMRLLHPDVVSDRVTGVQLTRDTAGISAAEGTPLFLLGAGSGIAAQAGAALANEYPGVAIADAWGDASPRPEDDARTLARIAASGARILLVAYGAPAQIHWIDRNLEALASAGVKVVIGIGGAFDYLSGNVPWAPAIIRRIGLEWLYRLVREPWRWRRQRVLPIFVVLVLRDWLRKKIGRGVE